MSDNSDNVVSIDDTSNTLDDDIDSTEPSCSNTPRGAGVGSRRGDSGNRSRAQGGNRARESGGDYARGNRQGRQRGQGRGRGAVPINKCGGDSKINKANSFPGKNFKQSFKTQTIIITIMKYQDQVGLYS